MNKINLINEMKPGYWNGLFNWKDHWEINPETNTPSKLLTISHYQNGKTNYWMERTL